MSPFDVQWQGLMENSPFSEEAVFKGETMDELHVRGIVYSGTYTIDAPARYATARATRKTYFACSRETLSNVSDPARVLLGVDVKMRNRNWRVKDISGNDNGNLMFELEEAQ